MIDYIDQERACNITFLSTFRQNLQYAKHKYDRDESFKDLCNTETSYVPEHLYLIVPDQKLCQQLVMSKIRCQKLRLDNIIFLCFSKQKWGMLPFEDEVDASTSITMHITENNPDDG